MIDLLVPEREKNKEWIKKIIVQLKNIDGYSGDVRSIDDQCWSLYHNNYNASRFDYFLKVGNNYLPAKPRHIPIQRHFVDSLASQQIYRPFIFTVETVDEDSVLRKNLEMINGYIGDLIMLITQKYHNGQAKIGVIDKKIQQINQALQVEPKDENEARALQQLASYVDVIISQFEAMKEIYEYENRLTKEEIDKLKVYWKFEHKDMIEHIGRKVLNKLRKKLSIKEKSNKNFLSYVVVGKQFYYVDLLEGEKWPRFDSIDSLKVTFPLIDNLEDVSDGPWVKLTEQLSFNQIVVEYGDEIKKEYGEEKLKELADISLFDVSTNARFVSTPNDGAMYVNTPYPGTFENGSGIEVQRIWFKSPRKIHIKYSPNPHSEDDYFRHFIDKSKVIIDENDYIYKAGRYYKKDNDSVSYDKDEVEKYNPKKGQSIKVKYTNDIYTGVVINHDIVIRLKKKKYVYRPKEQHSDVKLPIFGPAFSSITERPYSVIWSTKDLQELYDVVHTQRELMLALAGTRSIFYDRSQKPKDMTDADWEYQKKIGNILLTTYDTEGHRIQSTFNQWTSVDLSVSPSIQYLNEILMILEESMGSIIGVPRQRLGQTVNTDQVGTFKESINRSMLITEILYYKHDIIEARALNHLLNLTMQHGFKGGVMFEAFDSENGKEFLTVNPQLVDGVDFQTIVSKNGEQMQKMAELRELSVIGFKSGQLPYLGLLEVYNSETLSELQKKVEYFTKEAKTLMEKQSQNQFENEMALERAKAEYANQFESMWKQQEMQLKQMAEKVKIAKIQSDSELKQQELALKEKEIASNIMMKNKELDNEQQMETAVLINNDKHSSIEEQLKAIGMQIDMLMNKMQISASERTGIRQHDVNLRKVAVEDKKANKMVKEHTSDR